MNEMIEAVKLAIAKHVTCPDCDPDGIHEAARAAINAMREPTRDMAWAMLDELKRQNDNPHMGNCNIKQTCICKMNVPDLYRAMIDAALAEPTKKANRPPNLPDGAYKAKWQG